MKFLCFKQVTNSTEIKMTDMRVIDVPNDYSYEDQIKYAKDLYNSNFDVEENADLVVTPVKGCDAHVDVSVHCVPRIYDSPKFVTIKDKKNNTSYPCGVLVATLPAYTEPTDKQILEYYFRGNEKLMEACDRMDSIRIAIPWDRVVIDFGENNAVFPMSDNFVMIEQ